jgi:hypothetical protein
MLASTAAPIAVAAVMEMAVLAATVTVTAATVMAMETPTGMTTMKLLY